ncbi:MAG: hypothetical protein CMN30_09815 [Sandaracinus sp.]|nr:hypothetical protein [Sandaracinus sp.]|tara:strand:- start:2494 stop:2676 length:183 start_codon:yes stop_codon:yes gene_type:complete
MMLRVIQGGRSRPDAFESDRVSGELFRRPDRPPPPSELGSQLPALTVAVATLAALAFVLF